MAYRGLIPAERVAHLGLQRRCTVRLGPGAHFVHYFVGAGRLLNVVCVAEENAWRRESWTDRADVAELRAAFHGWHPVVQEIIDALDAPLKWALFDRDPLPCWGRGPVALLGDACHPMLPYGAQGYAQAVEDAAVLAACLADPRRATSRPRWPATSPPAPGSGGAGAGDLAGQRRAVPPRRTGRSSRRATRPWRPSFGLSPEIDWLYGHDVAADVGE